MKIGNVVLKNDLILAPMANYTDAGFRRLASLFGAGLTVTEMVSAKGLCYGNPNTNALLKIAEEGCPVAVQLFGSDPEYIKRAVEHPLLKPFDIIDINMGCPVPKIVKNGEGSALMNDPEKVYAIVKSAVENTDKPVTVKIRAGFSGDSVNAPEIAKVIEEAGGSAVSVHARTREQFYSGKADRDVIRRVKERVKIPVVGNGDVICKNDYLEMKKETSCDGVMIGRGALGRPYIFSEIQDKPYEFNVKDAIMQHIAVLKTYLPERTVINQMKAQLCWYAKNTRHAKEVRRAITDMNDMEKLIETTDKYFTGENLL